MRSKFGVLWFKIWSTDHNKILHMSRQCYCRDLCKISLWASECIMNKSIINFHCTSNSIKMQLVGQAPGESQHCIRYFCESITIWHMLRQMSCCHTCKIMTWFNQQNQNYSKRIFTKFSIMSSQTPHCNGSQAWVNPLAAGKTWVHTQHCGYRCPGAKAPGHWYPQCWLGMHYIGQLSDKNTTVIGEI